MDNQVEYVIINDKVLEINHDMLLEDGQPLIVEITLEEYQKILEENGTSS